jgi:hypothetical protein
MYLASPLVSYLVSPLRCSVRPKTGIGVVIDNAQDYIKKPVLTEEILLKRFRATVRDAFAMGLTSLHDAGFSPISLQFFKR